MLRAAAIQDLLSGWRAAERTWEVTPVDDPGYRPAAIAVLETWLAYQQATEQVAPGSFALVVDDDQRYVAVSDGVRAVLGYEPSELLGRQIEDIAAPELVETTPEQWAAFLASGRQDGTFQLRASDGSIKDVGFQARAHYPIAGFHLSRLWLRSAGAGENEAPA
jgi:PAS domain S-box-containing protein